jgi:hypothetical protein
MTSGPENPYGQPGPPHEPPAYEPPSPPPPYQQPSPPPYQQPSPPPTPPPTEVPAQPPAQPPYQQPYQQPGGYPQPPYGAGYLPPAYVPAPPNEGLAVASMVIGIVSLVLTCGYGIGLLGSPVAMVMGRISMKRIDRSEGQLGGRGMAQAGFVLGIVGTVLLLLAIVAAVIIIVVAVNGGFDDSSTYDNT